MPQQTQISTGNVLMIRMLTNIISNLQNHIFSELIDGQFRNQFRKYLDCT